VADRFSTVDPRAHPADSSSAHPAPVDLPVSSLAVRVPNIRPAPALLVLAARVHLADAQDLARVPASAHRDQEALADHGPAPVVHLPQARLLVRSEHRRTARDAEDSSIRRPRKAR
jgi:hypothetical protein